MPKGWGCEYGDNMNPTDASKDGSTMEYDMYIYLIRCIDNKAIDAGADYNSIPSSVYADIWIFNKQINHFKSGIMNLSPVSGGVEVPYLKDFDHNNREHWIIKDPVIINPYESRNIEVMIGFPDPQTPDVYRNHIIPFTNYSFPQSYMISQGPATISINSLQDFTVAVSNSMSVPFAGASLPAPDALSLYFCSMKLPALRNAFRVPIQTIPTIGGAPFTIVFPGKTVKESYDAREFDMGEGAAVVKAVKSYEYMLTFKEFNLNIDMRCLITLVDKSQKIYNFVP
ncbi:MAG: hypothetical protein JST55_11645 [Bacteroidetes bacterium]|nr:hypothetical protein [Bacteroidota bacterium]